MILGKTISHLGHDAFFLVLVLFRQLATPIMLTTMTMMMVAMIQDSAAMAAPHICTYYTRDIAVPYLLVTNTALPSQDLHHRTCS